MDEVKCCLNSSHGINWRKVVTLKWQCENTHGIKYVTQTPPSEKLFIKNNYRITAKSNVTINKEWKEKLNKISY